MTLVDVNRIIEERVNIVDVVRRYVKLQSAGRRQTGLCPFHKEKTPSFSVNEERQFYHCFGCGAHGNALTFVMNIENLSFREAVKKLGTDFGIRELLQEQSTPEADRSEEERRQILAINRLAALFFHRKLGESREASDYLAKRGITPDTIKRFGLGWIGNGDELILFLRNNGVASKLMEKSGLTRVDQNGNLRSFFHDRIMVPVVNMRRQVIGFGGRIIGPGEPKYLNTAETPVFLKRASLFGINLIRDGLKDHKYIILTEGYFDVMALHAHGFGTAVAALGTAITEDHLKLIERFGVPLVMILDGDAAGRKAMRRVLDLALPEKLDLRAAFIESPDGKEDPDSLVRRPDGKERMEAVIAGAKDITQHYIDDLAEQALWDPNIPARDVAKDEMARLILRFPLNKRMEYLNNLGDIHRRHHNFDETAAKKLRKEVDLQLRDIAKRERGNTASRNDRAPESGSVAKRSIPAELTRELFVLAATHRSLIPALDDPFLQRYDLNDLRIRLLTAHDSGEGNETYEKMIAELDRDGKLVLASGKLTEAAAATRFQQIVFKLRIADIDKAVLDLKTESSPDAIAEIQRLMNEKKHLSASLTMGTGAAT
ncbi:MAG TPA: DNA primase [bacterium]|nr:DNA primase [bacterium]